MKILQLTSSLAIGGVTSVVSNLSHELMKNHEVTIGCYKPYTDEITIDTDGLTIVRYDSITDYYWDIKHKQYDVIHFHVMLKSGVLAMIAHMVSPHTVLVCHSHWSQYNKSGLVFSCYESLSRFLIHRYIDLKLGCSDLAGQYLYPNGQFITVNNAINSEKFAFNETYRSELRMKYHLENCFVVGYVGQFNTVKNIPFLIQSVLKARESNPKIYLMLVGGPMNEVVKPYIDQYEWIISTGLVTDAYRYYSAFDCFALSSLWEGMPMVALEAQANGLWCLLSDTITRLLNIDNRILYLALDIDRWANQIAILANSEDQSRTNHVSNSIFDVKEFSKIIEQLYMDEVKKGHR